MRFYTSRGLNILRVYNLFKKIKYDTLQLPALFLYLPNEDLFAAHPASKLTNPHPATNLTPTLVFSPPALLSFPHTHSPTSLSIGIPRINLRRTWIINAGKSKYPRSLSLWGLKNLSPSPPSRIIHTTALSLSTATAISIGPILTHYYTDEKRRTSELFPRKKIPATDILPAERERESSVQKETRRPF